MEELAGKVGDKPSKAAMSLLKKRENDTGNLSPQYIKRQDGTVEKQLTAGYGHLLAKDTKYREGDTITQAQADEWLAADSAEAWRMAGVRAEQAENPELRETLFPVEFQLGGNWVNEHPTTWGHVKEGRYAEAADEAARGSKAGTKSAWFEQTENRVVDFQDSLNALKPKIERV